MRDSLKLKVGGAKEYIYLTDRQHTVKSLSDIPKNAPYIEICKSWTDFTKDERAEMIDFTIKEMIEGRSQFQESLTKSCLEWKNRVYKDLKWCIMGIGGNHEYR